MFITPSKEAYLEALAAYDDDYLYSNSVCGRLSRLSAAVKILYAPTASHLHFLLAVLRVSETATKRMEKVTLDVHPSLIILHEPSRYFLKEDPIEVGQQSMASYLSLVAHLFSCAARLGSSSAPCQVTLFDSELPQLKLPIIKPVEPESTSPSSPTNGRRRSGSSSSIHPNRSSSASPVHRRQAPPQTMDDDTTVQRDDIDEDDDGDGEEEEIRRASKTVLVTGLAEKFFARSIEFIKYPGQRLIVRSNEAAWKSYRNDVQDEVSEWAEKLGEMRISGPEGVLKRGRIPELVQSQ